MQRTVTALIPPSWDCYVGNSACAITYSILMGSLELMVSLAPYPIKHAATPFMKKLNKELGPFSLHSDLEIVSGSW